jgi:hypothetical protein
MTAAARVLQLPSTGALLDAWEAAQRAEPCDRILIVLAAMCGVADEDLDGSTPGELNRLALQAHTLLFGATCDAVAQCADCGEELEATIPLSALMSAHPPDAAVGEAAIAGLRVRYRLPTLREITALGTESVDDAAARLLASCVVAIKSGPDELTLNDLPQDAVRAIDDAISSADSDAVIDVLFVCPECGESARLPMDPAAFLWDELDRWALSVLSDVIELAAAFGWTEGAVLSLSPWRRQAYLSMAGVGRWSS